MVFFRPCDHGLDFLQQLMRKFNKYIELCIYIYNRDGSRDPKQAVFSHHRDGADSNLHASESLETKPGVRI